jgi:hypothetical protein
MYKGTESWLSDNRHDLLQQSRYLKVNAMGVTISEAIIGVQNFRLLIMGAI